jgi:histone H3/H4
MDTEKRGLSNAAVLRVSRNDGENRIGKKAVGVIRAKAEEYICGLAEKAQMAANHAGRKIVSEKDVLFACGGPAAEAAGDVAE